MKIGLLAPDSHNFPNLPLMKLSGWHKGHGDHVEWWNAEGRYDIVYCSVVFEETIKPQIANANKVIYGGSGIDLDNKLPHDVEHHMPDYGLYPQYDFAVGVLTRGCPRISHTFCITPRKDGCKSVKVADLSEWYAGQKRISLLDQNLLACREHKIDLLRQLAASGAVVDFKGGLDVRFVNDAVIDALRQIRIDNCYFAWDDPKEHIGECFDRLAHSGLRNPDRIGVYVLTNYWSTVEQDLYRIYTLRSLGFVPLAMIYDKLKYVDRRGRWLPGVESRYTVDQLRHFKICQYMQRWTANRALLKSCPDFNDYEMYKRMVSGDMRWMPKRKEGVE